MIALARVPTHSREEFLQVIPSELRIESVAGRANDVFSWYRNILLNFQGVLVDSCAASAMIGIKEEYFRSIIMKKLPSSCVYRGIFSEFHGQWFWRMELMLALGKMVHDDGTLEVSHYGEKITKDKSHWTKCRSCGEFYTELSAYAERDVNDKLNRRYPAHRRCVVISDEPSPMYFDPKYIIDKGMQ